MVVLQRGVSQALQIYFLYLFYNLEQIQKYQEKYIDKFQCNSV